MSIENAVKARRARKDHHCLECEGYRNPSIHRGDVYLVLTDFKGSDAGYALFAGHPVQAAICDFHALRNHRDLIEKRKETR